MNKNTKVWNNFFQNQQAKKPKVYQQNNLVETAKSVGQDVIKNVATELVGGVAKNATEQIGLTPKTSGLGGEISLTDILKNGGGTSLNQEIKLSGNIRPGIVQTENIITKEQIFIQRENQAMKQEIQNILIELKALAKSVNTLNSDIKKVVMETPPTNMGKYHKNFYEWVLSIIKDLRQKVCESRNWLAVFQSRKKQKGYWMMFKKHGTSFALSDERGISTSVG